MVVAGEIFTLDELNQLNKTQLKRVSVYLGINFSMYDSRVKLVERIMDFQYPKDEIQDIEIHWNGNPDWKPGVQRSVRVQRLYELNVLGKKL